MKTLYYFPLEQYPERYTQLMSCKGGWAESKFKKYGIQFVRIEGEQISNTIKNGNVLDASGRCFYAMSQLNNFIKNYLPSVKDGDVVYLEDFWHPGAESLFYIRHLCNVRFTIGCFCHAQSVDDTDFTWPMRHWMRPIEQGFGKQYDHIFTCSKILKRLLVEAGVGTSKNVHVTGLPFNSECLCKQLRKMGIKSFGAKKEDYVIFSSRFDDEKDPMFFLDLVERCKDIQFRLVSPYSTRPVSKNPEVMDRLNEILNRSGSNLQLISTTEKRRYYEALSRAKVQINCAHQDWVSWTLVEAAFMGCLPLYPIWKDFPLELRGNKKFLYKKRDLNDCEKKLRGLMKIKSSRVADFVVAKHDDSWRKYLCYLGLIES